MRVLFVEGQETSFESAAAEIRASGLEVDVAREPGTALWLLARGEHRVVVLDIESGPLAWEVIAGALWSRPPARVIGLAQGPVQPAMRRRAYGSGVWELIETTTESNGTRGEVIDAVRRAAVGAREPAALFVDECSEITEGIGSLLAGEGFTIETASTTEEAVARLSRKEYAIIITEARRIGPDGFEVMRRAARIQPDAPVVVLTACLDDEVFYRAVELGARGCIWKLSEPDDILREIMDAVEAGRSWGPHSIREEG